MRVQVSTMDAELEFCIQTSTTGYQLLEQVVKTVGLREIWFFGIQYTDRKGYVTWLELNKKVLKQDVKKEIPLQFKFLAKFYPEDVATDIIQCITMRLFYLQTRNAILADAIYCPAEISVLLASYAAQAKYGDYDSTFEDSFSRDRILPERVIDQHNSSRLAWEERIRTWWMEYKGMLQEDAMLEYMKIAQDLVMFGVNYYQIRNRKDTQLWLGVDALGLNIYEGHDRLAPKIGFPWSEIRTIKYMSKKFTIKTVDKKAPPFVFFAPRAELNKRIVAICQGNYQLYIRRRSVDTLEVQHMKIQAQKEQAAKLARRTQLQQEMTARREAEAKQSEYERQLSLMNKEIKMKQQNLLDAQDMIRRLESQLKRLKKTKENLEQHQNELSEMVERLAASKEWDLAVRQNLEKEIRLKEEEVRKIREEVDVKDEHTRQLQAEIELTRQRQNDYEADAMNHDENDSGSDSQSAHSFPDLVLNGIGLEDRFEDRETELEKNKRLQNQLEMLKNELASIRDASKLSTEDKQYQGGLLLGQSKYKTLREVRKGNTKRRVDLFENM